MVIDALPARSPDPVLDGGPLRAVTLSTDADNSFLPLVPVSVAQVGAVLRRLPGEGRVHHGDGLGVLTIVEPLLTAG
jgi:hypothetical protein